MLKLRIFIVKLCYIVEKQKKECKLCAEKKNSNKDKTRTANKTLIDLI